MKPVVKQKISYNLKDKLKRQLMTNIKNSSKFFDKGMSKPLKPYSMPLETFPCTIVLFLNANKVACELLIMW